MEAVLRPSQALLANNKQDITGTDNHYTTSNPPERGSYVCFRYKELFTLYDYVRRLCRIIEIPFHSPFRFF